MTLGLCHDLLGRSAISGNRAIARLALLLLGEEENYETDSKDDAQAANLPR